MRNYLFSPWGTERWMLFQATIENIPQKRLRCRTTLLTLLSQSFAIWWGKAMDWELITRTLEHLETLSAQDLAQELDRLGAEDSDLSAAVAQLRGNRENAASFMQTHMPGSPQHDGATLELGSRIGIWQIDELLGTGGMGEVYRATRADGLFDQQVALKLSSRMGDEFAARFEAERQRLAQLEHPNIARIVDGGTSDDGAPYMTMEFVEGHAIDEHVRQNHLDRRKRLALIERLCAAAAHAHGRLVLHRDIKHDNVLINRDGELRLIDFGVASLIGDGAEQGGFSSLTPGYAAPEQLTGKAVSAGTDIFAIGMLAHLLEAGALPKRQSDGSVAIDAAAIDDADLAAILAKATADNPADRYGAVDALGYDLGRFLNGFPVAARPVSSFTKFKKMVARNTLTSAMSGVAALALIAGVIGVSAFAVRASEENERYRISELQAAALTEFYESSSSGFASFVASLDPASKEAEVILSAMGRLEEQADTLPLEEATRAAEIYIFLSDFYASAGMITESGVIAQKLADPKFEMSFATANILMNAALFASGPEDKGKAIGWLNRASAFFGSNEQVYDYEIVMSNCIRSRLTLIEPDQRICFNSAKNYLSASHPSAESIDMAISANRTLQAYAIDEGIRLGEYDDAARIAGEALATYRDKDLLTSIPAAAFWFQLAKIENERGDFDRAKSHLISARKSIEGKPEFGFYHVALSTDLAKVENGAKRHQAASEAAADALTRALEIYGPDNVRVSSANAQQAIAQAGLGNHPKAIELMTAVLEFERRAEGEADKIAEFEKLLAEWSQR